MCQADQRIKIKPHDVRRREMYIQNWPNGPRLQTNLRTVVALLLMCGTILLLPGDRTGTATAQAVKASTVAEPVLHSRLEGSLRIGVGDMVQVNVFDTPELSAKLRVNA